MRDDRCPRCGEPLAAQTVRTAIWQGEHLAVVEDIPAFVCSGCLEQFYDDDVSDALRRLTEHGFPSDDALREISVPVFSLAGRVRRRAPAEDADVDGY
jgi:YgiT-type zinc finger domain-containing protein